MAGLTGLGKRIENFSQNIIQGGESFLGTAKSIVGNYLGSLGSQLLTGDFVGMDYNQVPAMRQAIRDYVKNIQDAVDKLNTDANANQAMHGEIETATKSYVQSVSDAAKAYTSQLLKLSDNMQEAYESFLAHEEHLSGEISGQSKDLSGSVETYTEQK